MPIQPGETIAVIDVGGSRIKTLIGTIQVDQDSRAHKLSILGMSMVRSAAMRRGNIFDMEEFKRNVDEGLAEAEKMAGEQVSRVTLCVSGPYIETVVNRGIVAVNGEEIAAEDVGRVLDMATNGVMLQNRTVMKVIPESFAVDADQFVKSPLGMTAKKLEVTAHIFSMASNVFANVKKGFSDIGIDPVDAYPSLLAASEAVLSRRQKELGVVCVDVGLSSTGVTVFEEGVLRHAATVPIGGEHVTSDIALGARISTELAEKLKIEYGDAVLCLDDGARDEEIELSKLDKNETGTLSRKYLSEIVSARYKEILHYVNVELKRVGRDGMLPEGAVLTGGGAKMRGLVPLVKSQLRLPSSVGVPEEHEYISGTSIADPLFASAVGTLLLVDRYGQEHGRFKWNFSFGSLGKTLKNAFKFLIP